MNSHGPAQPPDTPRIAWFSLRSLLIGLLPMVVVLTLMCGSLDAAVTMVFWSVVCPLGIGAVFWAALAMLIGAGLQVLVPSLQARRPATADGRRIAAATSHPDPLKPLIDYAVLGLERGLSAERLSGDLLRAGWTETEVQSALEAARQRIATAAGTGPEGPADAR
ncbi:MAG: hypothetical protein ACKO0M_14670 [Cyanobium sp.]